MRAPCSRCPRPRTGAPPSYVRRRALVEFAIEVADPREPMVMVLNTGRLVALMRGQSLAELVEATA